MNPRIIKLLESIELIQKEISEIRDKCDHPEYYVGFWSSRPGAHYPSRICLDCGINIHGITNKEANDFMGRG